jgi:hypothetical protein
MVLVLASKSVLVVCWPGSKPAGLPSEQNTSVPEGAPCATPGLAIATPSEKESRASARAITVRDVVAEDVIGILNGRVEGWRARPRGGRAADCRCACCPFTTN